MELTYLQSELIKLEKLQELNVQRMDYLTELINELNTVDISTNIQIYRKNKINNNMKRFKIEIKPYSLNHDNEIKEHSSFNVRIHDNNQIRLDELKNQVTSNSYFTGILKLRTELNDNRELLRYYNAFRIYLLSKSDKINLLDLAYELSILKDTVSIYFSVDDTDLLINVLNAEMVYLNIQAENLCDDSIPSTYTKYLNQIKKKSPENATELVMILK